METKEKIGEYAIIKSGEVTIFNNAPIEISVYDSTTICIRIEFEHGDGKFFIEESLDKNTHILRFSNLNVNSVCGTFEPIDIAVLDSGEILYIIANAIILDAEKGNGIFRYSLLTK